MIHSLLRFLSLALVATFACAAADAAPATLPATVTAGAGKPLWIPSGYMGNTGSIKMEESPELGKNGKKSLKVTYDSATGWGGVVWQDPANDWGDQPGGFALAGAKVLRAWIRGAAGGETVTLGFGVLGKDKPHHDSANQSREVKLTTDWQEVVFDVAALDLSVIKTGFFWSTAASGAPVTFYLSGVQWE